MSYYAASWRNPVPYTSSDVGAPVPGWGVDPTVAGPPRVGVGQAKVAIDPSTLKKLTVRQPPADTGEQVTPWWVWPAGAAVLLGGLGYIGTKQGWF